MKMNLSSIRSIVLTGILSLAGITKSQTLSLARDTFETLVPLLFISNIIHL